MRAPPSNERGPAPCETGHPNKPDAHRQVADQGTTGVSAPVGWVSWSGPLPFERTFELYCGRLGCPSRKALRTVVVPDSRIVDGEKWMCIDCGGNWSAGTVRHFPADSPIGRWIAAQLAAATVRVCAAPGCDEPVTGRGDRRYHSDACRMRDVRDRRKRPRNAVFGPDLPDTPLARTSGRESSLVDDGVAGVVIADTVGPFRRCAECGRGIDHRRAGAVVCGDACRKRLARRARVLAAGVELSDLLGVAPEASP